MRRIITATASLVSTHDEQRYEKRSFLSSISKRDIFRQVLRFICRLVSSEDLVQSFKRYENHVEMTPILVTGSRHITEISKLSVS